LLTRAVTLVWAVAAASVLWHGFPATTGAKTVLILSAVYAVALAVAGMLSAEVEAETPTERTEPTDRAS
ncbi:hypothetical protein ACSTIP_00020, partial [Vibrio parahaemolyticus]